MNEREPVSAVLCKGGGAPWTSCQFIAGLTYRDEQADAQEVKCLSIDHKVSDSVPNSCIYMLKCS